MVATQFPIDFLIDVMILIVLNDALSYIILLPKYIKTFQEWEILMQTSIFANWKSKDSLNVCLFFNKYNKKQSKKWQKKINHISK